MAEIAVILPLAVDGVEDVVLAGPVGPDQGQAIGSGDRIVRDDGYEVAVLPGVLDQRSLSCLGALPWLT